MIVFEVVIVLLLVGAALSSVARKIGAPYPVLVSLGGVAIAFLPGIPSIVLDPELALALFIAPVLLAAAYETSPRDLEKNWRTVASLAIGAVVVTIAVVAVLCRMLLPELPWGAAIALGALVAPPDAAAATAILRQLHLPHRVLVILEGESLFNDASSLLIYRLAVAVTLAGAILGASIIETFIVLVFGSIVLGFTLSWVMMFFASRIKDVSTAIVVQFCGTFAVWIIAEHLKFSGILTMVVFAMVTARKSPQILESRMRIPTWAVWDVAVFILNVLAFVFVGFQIKLIAARVDVKQAAQYLVVVSVVCVAVIITRILWVVGATVFSRWLCRLLGHDRNEIDIIGLSFSEATAIGWSGMRGTVTLAAALASSQRLSVSRSDFGYGIRSDSGDVGDSRADA